MQARKGGNLISVFTELCAGRAAQFILHNHILLS